MKAIARVNRTLADGKATDRKTYYSTQSPHDVFGCKVTVPVTNRAATTFSR